MGKWETEWAPYVLPEKGFTVSAQAPKKIRILMVEDDPDFSRLMGRRLQDLKKGQVEIAWVADLQAAIRQIEDATFDLILLDLMLPDSRGIETFMRVQEKASGVPIVVLSGVDDQSLAVRALQLGAQDYLLKGEIDGVVLMRTLLFSMERHRILKEWKQAWESEYHSATHDPLTMLPNRVLFQDRLSHGLSLAKRHGHGLAILFIDLDRFKQINDALGHPTGDRILKMVAQRLSACVRGEDTMARLGGDEFVALIYGVMEEAVAMTVVNRMLKSISQPFFLKDQKISVTCSIGISLFPRDGIDPMALIESADLAMYRAKDLGGGQSRSFQKTGRMQTRLVR